MNYLFSCILVLATCHVQAQEGRRIYVDKSCLAMKNGTILVRFSQGMVSVKQFGVDDVGYYVFPNEFMVPKSDGT